MSNIIGDKSIIKLGKDAPAGSKYNFINWEAVDEMPEQFETVVTGIKFKLDKDFIKMAGGKYYPNNDLSYKIAEACGISGCEDSYNEPLFAEVNINPMFCKSLLDAPNMRNIQIGAKVTKRSKRQMEDGTYIYSSACTQEYNVWNRCLELWSNEEELTEGYTIKNPKNKWGKTVAIKYDTQYKRQSHFYSELKFATAKAETKAYCKSIRELASMPTGFEASDLAKGVLIFSKVRISTRALKLRQAAELAAISGGKTPEEEQTNLLFGEEPKTVYAEELTEIKTNRPSLLDVLESYSALISDDETLPKMIEWVKKVGDEVEEGKNKVFFDKVINYIKTVEETLDNSQLIEHDYH